ncbi:MAG: hypothetical protein ACRDSR_01245 [Pseudonocardiaceae bacterium]
MTDAGTVNRVARALVDAPASFVTPVGIDEQAGWRRDDGQPRAWSAEQLALLRDLDTIVAQVRQLADRCSGLADTVHGLAELAEQHEDLRLHRCTATAVSQVGEVTDLISRLEQQTATQRRRADELVRIDLRVAVGRAVQTALATRTGAIEADLGPVALPVRCDPWQCESSITHVLVAAQHQVTGERPLRVVLTMADLHASAPVARLTVSGPSSRVPASELARMVARLRAATGEAMAERSHVGSIRMVAGRTSASAGPLVAQWAAGGLMLVGQWTLDRPAGSPLAVLPGRPGGTSGGRHRRGDDDSG